MASAEATITSFHEAARRAGAVSAASLLSAVNATAEPSVAWVPPGRFVECVCAGPSVGGQSLVEALLAENRQRGCFAALVDACDGFDPGTLRPGLEAGLLWVRCKAASQALKSLDLLLRDTNFSLVIADLRAVDDVLRTTPSAQWYRLQRLAHQRPGRFVALCDAHLGPAVDIRVELATSRGITALEQPRSGLLVALKSHVAMQHEPTARALSSAG